MARKIIPANEVIGLGIIVPKQTNIELLEKVINFYFHKEKRENGDLVFYGETGFDKDNCEMIKRLFGIEFEYKRIPKIKLCDVIPNFEKIWAEFNDYDADYGNDGWDIEREKADKKRKNSNVSYDNIVIGCL